MNRHPIFFVTNWYIFEVGCWVLSTLNMFSFASLSLFCSCQSILVLISCIYCKNVLRPSLRYTDVFEIVLVDCSSFFLAQLGDPVTTLAVGGID